MKKQNIVLIGFMGTGKTTTGMLLSEKLGYRFIDTDDEIERKCGMAISEIFKQKGEQYFREIEMEVVNTISELNHAVIACGGGVVKNPDSVLKLKRKGLMVCLFADNEAIYNRISGNDTRPLVAGKSKEEIYRLIDDRKQLYSVADIFIDTSDDGPLSVANRVIDIFKIY